MVIRGVRNMFCSRCGEEQKKQKNSVCPNCGNNVFTPYKLKGLNWKKPKESDRKFEDITFYPNIKVNPEHEAEKWFYVFNGERYGPVSRLELLHLYNAERVFLSTKVWKSGMSDWADIGQTDLIDRSIVPPPLKGEDINNTLVWIMAFTPILGTLLEFILSGAIGVASGSLWFITPILNAILGVIDQIKLKRAGHNTKEMLLWALFIIPVYLFRRAHILKQKSAYAIVWCITFAILIFAPTLISGIIGIADPSAVDMVKEGTMNSYPDKTISQMVDNYFLNPKWKAIVADDNNTYVNVIGEITYLGDDTKVLIQYKLINDSSFEFYALEFNGVPQDMTTYIALMNSMYAE